MRVNGLSTDLISAGLKAAEPVMKLGKARLPASFRFPSQRPLQLARIRDEIGPIILPSFAELNIDAPSQQRLDLI